MLEELSKNNDQWFKMAFQICKDKETAKDLVQEMYLKLHLINKDINFGYVYFTIKSIWLNQLAKNKEIPFEEFTNLIESEYDLNNDSEIQYKIDLINEKIENAPLVRKVIVKHSFEKGLRQFSRESQISKATIQKHRQKFKEEIWQEIEKKQKDLEM